ncbi:uncharacterized protein LOC108252511 [Diaphorina citri]|uniref:Uncharacterized protein LOC108252511 n=1 Tax=Diaphorina citri TaxID=121845 RepID=A0A1S4ECS9_DIACI|nr:uncharacterized protein LOC108252511 [Diaphorina citri]
MEDHRLICHTRQCLFDKTYETNTCVCIPIAYKDEAKYLGVYLDNTFQMKEHVHNICKKLRIIKYKLNKINAQSLPLTTKKIIYYSLVDSILRYGVTLYSYAPKYTLNVLNTQQKQIIKLLFQHQHKNILCLNPEELSIFTLIYTNFFTNTFRQLTFQTCQLRHQAFKRVKVNTVRYGNRRLEYCVPRLLNDFCQDFLEETNRYRVKQKLKESLVAKRCLHD